ncbi:hypothetical protein EHQ39_00410 [Leptospira levettii]|nr:hypothetical protein EHQ39_00410 [Leptospira levettii]
MFLQKLFYKSQPYSIFFLDAIGASISLIVLLIVIIPFQSFFGMPIIVLYQLGVLALIMFTFSSLCFYWKPKHWKPFLLGVIFGNLTYCGVSMYFLIENWNVIQPLGAFYFIWEKFVILAIVAYEIVLLKK